MFPAALCPIEHMCGLSFYLCPFLLIMYETCVQIAATTWSGTAHSRPSEGRGCPGSKTLRGHWVPSGDCLQVKGTLDCEDWSSQWVGERLHNFHLCGWVVLH